MKVKIYRYEDGSKEEDISGGKPLSVKVSIKENGLIIHDTDDTQISKVPGLQNFIYDSTIPMPGKYFLHYRLINKCEFKPKSDIDKGLIFNTENKGYEFFINPYED